MLAEGNVCVAPIRSTLRLVFSWRLQSKRTNSAWPSPSTSPSLAHSYRRNITVETIEFAPLDVVRLSDFHHSLVVLLDRFGPFRCIVISALIASSGFGASKAPRQTLLQRPSSWSSWAKVIPRLQAWASTSLRSRSRSLANV